MPGQSFFQLIRNATVVFYYAGKKFLIDPMLAPKDTYPGFEGTANSHLRNPLVDLPVTAESLLDFDAIIVTHLHLDHWDPAAVDLLPKDKPLFAQNDEDAVIIRSAGFTDVRVTSEQTVFDDITFAATHCQHGSDAAYAIPQLAERLGKSSGLYFTSHEHPSVYFIGDSIWVKEVEANLISWKPDVVVVNAGDARLTAIGGIIMGKEDVYEISKLLPAAKILAIHMEALNHCGLLRNELGEFAADKGFEDRLYIPADGEVLAL
jgi:L-ascorbate metabolism protein UlaG (beta-lactamase superfamily)